MGNSIQHRGPDAEGSWFDEKTGIGITHRRLSIQDTSSSGAQPMTSKSGRYVIAFNGEIYNFNELREDFIGAGHTFRGHSDTEVMLACFEKWGVYRSLSKFEGMFAFALFDAGDNVLHLARDRMGEKPLYYGWNKNNTLLFGSELKALRHHPDFNDKIDQDSVSLLLTYNYIPAPFSIYKSIKKLEPGCCLTISLNTSGCKSEKFRYWDISSYYSDSEHKLSSNECTSELERLLKQSIRQQMISDVPLGAFLSGGVDSSTVVALMQLQSVRPIKTFCIGFDEKGYNEACYAKAVAAHLGTDHTELYINSNDTLKVIPSLPTIYDEPFADSSQIPTYLISHLASQSVTVSLTGDGGDELFCGYDRYFETVSAWTKNSSASSLLDNMEIMALQSIPAYALAPLIKLLSPSQRSYSLEYICEKIERHNDIRLSKTLQEYYEASIRYWFKANRVVKHSAVVETSLKNYPISDTVKDAYKQLMLLDIMSYLPDDILVKVDRAAMANSLETRVPFLNHHIVEFAARLPSSMQTNGMVGKLMLRDILYKYVPKSLIERPKQGFAVPLAQWLREDLKDWAASLLCKVRLRDDGYFQEQIVNTKWQEHLSGKGDHSFQLWGVIAFQAWLEHVKNHT